jgi:hypothetical protein
MMFTYDDVKKPLESKGSLLRINTVRILHKVSSINKGRISKIVGQLSVSIIGNT